MLERSNDISAKYLTKDQITPNIIEQLVVIDLSCFGDGAYSRDQMQSYLTEPDSLVVVINKFGQIIGFTITRKVGDIWPSRQDEENTIRIINTAIVPQEQHKGYVASLMSVLEREIEERGFTYMERNCAVDNGYADIIERVYSERIVEQNDHDSKWGPQRFFRIKV
jgi:ribosomal protein S18 acetylase RimI-like enzyme